MKAKFAEVFCKLVLKNLDGRSQRWLSVESGVSQSRISRILTKPTSPDVDELVAILGALGIEPAIALNVMTDDLSGIVRSPEAERHHSELLGIRRSAVRIEEAGHVEKPVDPRSTNTASLGVGSSPVQILEQQKKSAQHENGNTETHQIDHGKRGTDYNNERTPDSIVQTHELSSEIADKVLAKLESQFGLFRPRDEVEALIVELLPKAHEVVRAHIAFLLTRNPEYLEIADGLSRLSLEAGLEADTIRESLKSAAGK